METKNHNTTHDTNVAHGMAHGMAHGIAHDIAHGIAHGRDAKFCVSTNPTAVPELRFPEFSGDWQVKTLGECFEMLQNNTLSRAELNDKCGDYQNVHYGDVLIKYGSILDLSKEQLPYINNNNVAEKYEKSLLKDGDVIIADTAEDETVGKCTEIINVGEKKIISGLHTIPIRPTIDFAKCFIGLYFNSNVWHSQLLRIMQGTKVSSISKSQLKNISVCFPTLSEQRKIAACLSSLDNLIAQTRKKVDLLKQHKKGLMQKLFPRSGCNVPELRFPEFSGDWQVKPLGFFLNEHKLKSTGKEVVYSVSVSKGLVNQIEHLGRSFAAADTSKYNLVKPYDIVYTKSPTGSFPYGIVKQSQVKENVIVSPLYGVFSPTNKYIGYIIHCYFESIIRTNNYLASLIKKGARNTIQITNNTFLSKNVLFPTEEGEQRKIADCLSSIDKAIEETENKVRLLEQHKKGLMQRMFVRRV
jgi:type I restriction enzyme S subunit